MLEFVGINKTYPNNVQALKNINFKVEDGEFVFLIGASGAGKSSLIKMLLREIKPTSGTIVVDGVDIVKLKNRKIPQLRKSMGVVFQDFRLLEGKTVFDNVKYPLQILGVSKKEIKTRVTELLELVGLSDRANAYPNQLSGGEQQRVCIARAIANRPKFLIADEPTGNLDPLTSKEIMKALLDVNGTGTTVLVSTHDREIVDSLQKRVICLIDGELVSDEEKGGYNYEQN